MIHVSAFTVVRNEEVLITKHLAELARWGSEVLCVVQPSSDCTLLFARNAAAHLSALGIDCKVVSHEPERLGKEFSVAFALEQCAHDWCFNLDADETYLGRAPCDVAEEAAAAKAVSFAHAQAVGSGAEVWFKAEPVRAKVRLVDRRRLDPELRFDLHVGLDELAGDEDVVHLAASRGRIIEYKAAWQHYVDQLFYEAEGSPVNEAAACRALMPPQALELGETAFRIGRRVAGRDRSRTG